MITRMDIHLKFIHSIGLSDGHISQYRDDVNKISAETVTPRLSDGFSFGKPSTTYYIDNDDREFKDIDSLIEAYNELYKYSEDNPEMEVVYVKTIRKRRNQS
ncbi:hypothetical protein D0T84_00960 [Dysgonomonas sp. 521]|uniref:hypothetical protein n=1 Tax=Dysgonomonas sp. 521 TaxID=2302932 RepID=UPI0013D01B4F|nr:hypothetical protein [Dysgonomonas sp. 521]NDV93488.1 hypothetical protein [Dysgonomonas sp. 521]